MSRELRHGRDLPLEAAIGVIVPDFLTSTTHNLPALQYGILREDNLPELCVTALVHAVFLPVVLMLLWSK